MPRTLSDKSGKKLNSIAKAVKKDSAMTRKLGNIRKQNMKDVAKKNSRKK